MKAAAADDRGGRSASEDDARKKTKTAAQSADMLKLKEEALKRFNVHPQLLRQDDEGPPEQKARAASRICRRATTSPTS